MINILGVNISDLNKKEILNKLDDFLNSGNQHYITTPNPEIILKAIKDEEFFYIIHKSSLAIPDGVGLKFAGWLVGKNIKRFTGADLAKNILNIAQAKKLKVAILNMEDGLSRKEDLEKVLNNLYSKLSTKIINVGRGVQLLSLGAKSTNNLINFKPDILFVTLGAPYQEKIIYHILPKLPSVKLAIGVGGAFDFLTGKIKRAPKFMRIIGLEWLWRLFKQPRRWKRIYNAVIVFPIKFFTWRFILPFTYRPNVACLLYKIVGDNYKILIVERGDLPGHWQLPQGGLDGESIEVAGRRELGEEVGTDKFKDIKTYKNLHKYKFAPNPVEKYNYKGQKQSLFIAQFQGQDSDIKVNFWEHKSWKWVEATSLVNEVNPVRRNGAKIFLDKFNEITENR
ncbi:MAG: WecB/TagA/CpsF family glycosyltransferase [Patescibacteria group bacterium]